MAYFLDKTKFRAQEQVEKRDYEKRKEHAENQTLQGTNNSYVGNIDYRTPVKKKEYLKMLEKMEGETTKPEVKKTIHQEYMRNKIYGSEEGTK